MDELAGRVAVITGAASGIGFGIAEALAEEGVRLVLADVDADRLRVAGQALGGLGADLTEVVTDVRDAASVDALAATTVKQFGEVHVLCNNAGVWTVGYQWETELADWQWVVDVNLWGVVHGVRAFTPLLLANPEGGHVVNTASMGGLIAGTVTGPYTATKHAVVGLSKGLRAELAMKGSNVGVTVVCPGKVATPILQHVGKRPGATADAQLPGEVQAIADAMRSGSADVSAKDAGRMIRSAIKRNQFWVFPGAHAHRPLLQRETDDLLGAFTTS